MTRRLNATRRRFAVALALPGFVLFLLALAPGSASATDLCSVAPPGCTPYAIGTTVKIVEIPGTPAEFITQQGTTKCGEDVGEFKTTNAAPLKAKISSLVFSECLSGCNTVTPINLGWDSTIAAAGGLGNGIMTAAGSALGVKLEGCPAGWTSCTLSATKIEFVITGGNPALVTVKAALSGTASCGSSVWTSTFKAVSPTPLYVH